MGSETGIVHSSDSGWSYQVADGSVLKLEAPGYDLLPTRASSTFRIRTVRPYAGVADGLDLREFHVAYAGNYDHVVKDVLVGRWVHRLSAQSGQYLIAHSDDGTRGLAIWRGRWHEAMTSAVEPGGPASEVIGRFGGLDFVDSERGLRVRPRLPSSQTIELLDVVTYVPGVGLLTILPARSSAAFVPAWRGAPVGGGEVWKIAIAGAEDAQQTLVHATPTTVMTIQPDQELPDLTSALRFLESLTELVWTSA